MTPRAHRLVALATALLFLLGLLALVTVDGRAVTPLARIAAATKAKGTARIAMAVSHGATNEGVVDLRAGRSRITIRTPWIDGPVDVVGDGTTTYVATASLPHLKATGNGKPWVVDDSVTIATGMSLGTDLLGGDVNPVRWLRLLENERVAGEVEERGAAVVRGEHTTRSVGKVDVDRLLGALGTGGALAIRAYGGRRAGEVEAWVADDGALRRLVFRVRLAGFRTTVTIELFEFGTPADVAVPPPDQVHRLGT